MEGRSQILERRTLYNLPLRCLAKIPFTAGESQVFMEPVDKGNRCLSEDLKGLMAEKQLVHPYKSQKHRRAIRTAYGMCLYHPGEVQTRVQSRLSQ